MRSTILCILDGWGISDSELGNAPLLAKTPNVDRVLSGPNATLITYGPDVGLPVGQMGNSEVGHMNIGAGRVVEMDLRRIDGAIERGSLGDQPAVQTFINTLKDTGGTAHLMGVMSDGGVHAQLEHLIVMTRIVTDAGLPVALHLFTDGRDVGPQTALSYLDQLEAALPTGATIATMSGRYYAMDRDNRWERVSLAYEAITFGKGPASASARETINAAYDADLTDEFILPTVIGDYQGIAENDGVMLLNFRADRARQIMAAIGDPSFAGFDIGARPKLAIQTGMAEYSDQHNTYMQTIFGNQDLPNTIGEWVAKKGLKQFRVAETEKYPHVTFFFNGGEETPNEGEERYLAPSPKVATYDLQPEMSAAEVTDALVKAINSKYYALLIVNYANPDMVGHTGDTDAAIKACEAVDQGLGKVLAAVDATDAQLLLCADHGNCDIMINPETGGPHTAHTLNPVPVALYNGPEGATLKAGRLADLSPTLLALMGIDQPAEMTGESLLS